TPVRGVHAFGHTRFPSLYHDHKNKNPFTRESRPVWDPLTDTGGAPLMLEGKPLKNIKKPWDSFPLSPGGKGMPKSLNVRAMSCFGGPITNNPLLGGLSGPRMPKYARDWSPSALGHPRGARHRDGDRRHALGTPSRRDVHSLARALSAELLGSQTLR